MVIDTFQISEAHCGIPSSFFPKKGFCRGLTVPQGQNCLHKSIQVYTNPEVPDGAWKSPERGSLTTLENRRGLNQ